MDDKKFYNEHYRDDLKNRRHVENKTVRFFEDRLLNAFLLHIHSRLIELGCGNGNNIHIFKIHHKKLNAVGIDNSEAAIGGCYVNDGSFYVMDALNTDFKNESFDTVFIRDVFHHVDNRLGLMDEAMRLCKRYGKIIIIEPNIKNWQVKIIRMMFPIERGLKTLRMAHIKRYGIKKGLMLLNDEYLEHSPKMTAYLLSAIKPFYWIFDNLYFITIPFMLVWDYAFRKWWNSQGAYRILIFKKLLPTR